MNKRPSQIRTLGLDLGMLTGWSIMTGQKLEKYGNIDMRKDFPNDGARIDYLSYTIHQMINENQPDQIVLEAATHQRGRAAEVWHSLNAAIKLECYRHQVPLYRISSSSIKSHLANTGKATKKQMIEAANNRFNLKLREKKPGDQDVADSIGVCLAAHRLRILNNLQESP